MRLIFGIINFFCCFMFGGISYLLGYGWIVKDSKEFLWNPPGVILNILFCLVMGFLCMYLSDKLE